MGFFDKVKKAGSDLKRGIDLDGKAMSGGEFTEDDLIFFAEKHNGQTPEQYHDEQIKFQKERAAAKAEEAEQKRLSEINDPKKHFRSTRSSRNIQIDEKHGLWRITNSLGTGSIYLYEDLLSYDLSTNGNVQVKGGLSIGRAVVGGAIVGPLGALLGGVSGKKKQIKKISRIEININVNGSMRSTRTISIFKGSEIDEDSSTARSHLKTAQQDLSMLDLISSSEPPARHAEHKEMAKTSSASTPSEPETSTSSADELRKFKGLLDDGIITQEEFDAKKKEILGL